MKKTKTPPKPCPLCHSSNVVAFQCGWSTVLCRDCGLKLSKAWGLRELVEFWNDRKPIEIPVDSGS